MKILKYCFATLMLTLGIVSLSSCGKESLGESIFNTTEEVLDPNSATYKFDKWLKENYLDVYNLQFLYKMADISTNMNYNLVPATYDNAVDLAVLCKYLWFDAYEAVTGDQLPEDPAFFLKSYGPRIILLVGSPAYNPSSGTMILGLAEGGVKISLFRVNSMRISDFNQMNEYYFKTMHHEFTHILHQTKTYPSEFNYISVGHYDSSNWQDRNEGQCASLGFVSTYASSEFREDFAETVANYIVKTDAQWNRILELASRGWASDVSDDVTADFYCYYYYPNNDPEQDLVYVNESDVNIVDGEKYYKRETDDQGNRIKVYDVEDTDGIDGKEAILQKVEIARTWLKDSWNLDLDALREEVQTRQANYDITELRKQVENIE